MTKPLFYHTTINITKLRTSTDDVFELWSKFPGAISLVETSANLHCIQHVKKIANRHKLRFPEEMMPPEISAHFSAELAALQDRHPELLNARLCWMSGRAPDTKRRYFVLVMCMFWL